MTNGQRRPQFPERESPTETHTSGVPFLRFPSTIHPMLGDTQRSNNKLDNTGQHIDKIARKGRISCLN